MVLFVHTNRFCCQSKITHLLDRLLKLNCQCIVIPKCKSRRFQSPWLCPLLVQLKIKSYDFSIWPMVIVQRHNYVADFDEHINQSRIYKSFNYWNGFCPAKIYSYLFKEWKKRSMFCVYVYMTHCQMLGKVASGLPAKIWRLVGCTEMLSW